MKLKRTRANVPRQIDNWDGLCGRFMAHLGRDYRGHKAEISSHMLTKAIRRCAAGWGVSDAQLMDALIRRDWLQPSAADTYIIRYDLVRR